jgi:hypothetical protein
VICPQNPIITWHLNKNGKPLLTADVDVVIYDKVGRTPQILNEK